MIKPRKLRSYRSSHTAEFLGKRVLKIFSKFTGEDLCRSSISIILQSNFIEITLWYGLLGIPLNGCFWNFQTFLKDSAALQTMSITYPSISSGTFPECFGKHKILYKFQSRFWKNHLKDFTLSYLTDKISNCYDSSLPTGMILIDIQKAFDTIDYLIALQKLQAFWFPNKVFNWFSPYFSSSKLHANIMIIFFHLPIYDAEFQKDPILNLYYFYYILTTRHRL